MTKNFLCCSLLLALMPSCKIRQSTSATKYIPLSDFNRSLLTAIANNKPVKICWTSDFSSGNETFLDRQRNALIVWRNIMQKVSPEPLTQTFSFVQGCRDGELQISLINGNQRSNAIADPLMPTVIRYQLGDRRWDYMFPHETGHALGLDDTYIEGVWLKCKDLQPKESIMCFDKYTSPQLDDRRGIRFIFYQNFPDKVFPQYRQQIEKAIPPAKQSELNKWQEELKRINVHLQGLKAEEKNIYDKIDQLKQANTPDYQVAMDLQKKVEAIAASLVGATYYWDMRAFTIVVREFHTRSEPELKKYMQDRYEYDISKRSSEYFQQMSAIESAPNGQTKIETIKAQVDALEKAQTAAGLLPGIDRVDIIHREQSKLADQKAAAESSMTKLLTEIRSLYDTVLDQAEK